MVQSVEDPPEDTIKRYFEQYFAEFKDSTKQERDQLIARHIKVLGTRFLDASYITQIFQRQKSFEEGNKFGMITFLNVFMKIQEL